MSAPETTTPALEELEARVEKIVDKAVTELESQGRARALTDQELRDEVLRRVELTGKGPPRWFSYACGAFLLACGVVGAITIGEKLGSMIHGEDQ